MAALKPSKILESREIMPKLNGKKFNYTAKGKKAYQKAKAQKMKGKRKVAVREKMGINYKSA